MRGKLALSEGSMLHVKELLLKQTLDAFSGQRDMSIKAALAGITQEEASWRADESMPTAEQIVRHVAWAKNWYCFQGFSVPMVIEDAGVNENGDGGGLPWEFPCGAAWGQAIEPGIEGAVGLLDRAHAVLVKCLEGCSEEGLGMPIPTRHGKVSAANFFTVMIIHDAYHAGTIRARRSVWSAARSS
jgi:hypothetical protein